MNANENHYIEGKLQLAYYTYHTRLLSFHNIEIFFVFSSLSISTKKICWLNPQNANAGNHR